MKGLTFHDPSAGFENLLRIPQNFGDNWPLASKYKRADTEAKIVTTMVYENQTKS